MLTMRPMSLLMMCGFTGLLVNSDDTALGLDVLVQGINPIVDIVAIHGLNGHREETWTAKNNVNWLRDPNMLSAIIPNARIMSWGYDANTHSTKELSAMYLYDHAQKLVSDLSLHRRMDKTDTRPIIFVAHSLGGIVLKSALIHSDSARTQHLYHHKSIITSTYGIMFMGTPHQGGEGVAWGKILVNVASIFVKTNHRLLSILERDSEALQQQLGQYTPIGGEFETKFAFETKATPLALGQAIIVVSRASAVVPAQVDAEPIAIMDNHINMVKFSSEKNSEFQRVASHLKLMADKAPRKVEQNWLTEGSVQAVRVGDQKQNFEVAFDLTGVPKTNAFIGRKADLNLIKEQLTPGEVSDRRKICVVYGLGGIGKTQMAIEYARLHKPMYTSFFWLDGKTEESLIQSLLLIASRLPKGQVLGVDNQEIKGLEESRKRAQEVLQWFALKENTQWLLVYDNIDKTSYEEETSDQNTESSSTYDITRYFPRGDTGSIIITTRLQRLVYLGSQVHLRKVDVLDGLLILEKHAGRSLKRTGSHTTSTNNSEIDEWDLDAVSLVERLGRLPLALVFAGSYISKTTIAKYLELYNKSWIELHCKMKNRNDYPERTIITTWQVSFDELKLKDEGAAKLLRLWGYLDNQELWFQLLQWSGYERVAPDWLRKMTATEITFLATVDTLLDYSLIDRNSNSESYSMHVVVHDWIRASINEKEDEGLLQIAITTIGLAVPENYARDSWIIQRRLLPHIIQCSQDEVQVSEVQDNVDKYASLTGLHKLGVLYQNQGRLAEAEAMYRRALVGREKFLGTEHVLTLVTVNNFGVLYRDQGWLTEAEAMYRRALAGYEKFLGTEHVLTLNTVNNLGLLYHDQGRLAEAEAMYERALAGNEKALDAEHMSTLQVVNNLGNLYQNQGQLGEAEAMYERALAGKEKTLGAEHASTLQTVNNLGVLYNDQGRLAEAEAMYERALMGKEKAVGAEHSSTLHAVHNLGTLYQNQGWLTEAEAMLQRALAGYEKVLGAEHASTLDTVNNLGNLYWNQGWLAKAEAMFQRALAGYEKTLGAEHKSTLDTVNNLGAVYQKQGQHAEAEFMYERALAGTEKTLGAEHSSTLHAVHNLGTLYQNQGRLAEAEAMFQRALAGYEKALGAEHKSTLDTVNNLGILYQNQGRLAEAESMYERALVGTEKTLGAEHVLTLDTVNNLGNLYRKRGRLAEAEAMYKQVLAGKEKTLGAEHSSTLQAVNKLGILYQNQGRRAEGEAMFQRALAGYEKALGVEHASTLDTVNNLGVLYQNQGRLAEAEAMYKRALVGKEKALGAEHASTLNTVNNLGDLYRDQGRLVEAEAMYKQALAGREKSHGAEHTSTLNVVNNLAFLYDDQGRLAEAEAMYEWALAGYKKALGAEHISTLQTVNNLGTIYWNQGRLAEAEAMYGWALAGKEKTLGAEHALTLNTVNNLGVLYADQGRLAKAEAMFKQALAGREKALGAEHTSTLGTINNLRILYRKQGRLAEADAIDQRRLKRTNVLHDEL